MKKRTIFLIVFFLILLIPIYAQSNDDFEVEQLRDGTLSIIRYNKIFNNRNAIIPSTLYGINVTRIGNSAFSPEGNLGESIMNMTTPRGYTNIIIPNSVIEIGNRAFYLSFIGKHISPNAIIDIQLSNRLRRIGDFAFVGGSSESQFEIGLFLGGNDEALINVKSIVLPNTLEYVGTNAFLGLNIGYLKIESAFSVPRQYTRNNTISPVFRFSKFTCIEIIGNLSDEWLNFVFDDTGFKNFYVSQGRRAGIYFNNGRLWTIGTRQDVERLLAVDTNQSSNAISEPCCRNYGTTNCITFRREYQEAGGVIDPVTTPFLQDILRTIYGN